MSSYEYAFDNESRSVARRALDLLNGMFVYFVLLCRILYHNLFDPPASRVLPMSEPTQHPTLVLFVSGLAGPRFFWRPVVSDFRSWHPDQATHASLRMVGNVSATYRPMQRDRAQDTLPQLFRHCERWGDRARLVLVGHSLGGVDVVWLGNAVRERYGGKVPMLTVSVCGAFGTNLAGELDKLGAHPSLQQAIHCREGVFLRQLMGRARTLPHHSESEQVFVMSRDDRTVQPPTNSLLYGLPGRRNRHIMVDGAGHTSAVAAASPLILTAVASFVCAA